MLLVMSGLSFTSLSFYMLKFLIHSYAQWTRGNRLVEYEFQDQTYYNPQEIWKWVTGSTLFKDFAEAICNDPSRFWWTQLALLYSMAWNLYMSVEGEIDPRALAGHAMTYSS